MTNENKQEWENKELQDVYDIWHARDFGGLMRYIAKEKALSEKEERERVISEIKKLLQENEITWPRVRRVTPIPKI